jgi:hypothetical protein
MYEYKPSRPSRSSGWILAAIGILILLAVAVPLIVRQDNEWERVFVPAAARLWAGGNIYEAGGAYLYPPFSAFATLPFLCLSHATGRFVFVSLNLICVAYVLRGAWRLAGGGRLTVPAEFRAALIGACCGIFYIHNCLVHQQTDVFIAALLVGGCLALSRDRPLLAATGFGLAAAMKCTPLLWAPYLIWRKRPLAAVWLVSVALTVNLMPDLVNRAVAGRTWIGQFASNHLLPLTNADHIPGSWNSEIVYNQSLAGASQRWLMTALRWTSGDCRVESTGVAVSPLRIRAMLLLVELVLVLLGAVAIARPFQPAREGGDEVLEHSVVLLLMLLLSPMSSMAHFGILVLPGFCLARRAIARREPLLTVLLLTAAVAACASNKDLMGGRLYTVSLWGGCVMWNTLFLLVACLRELLRRDEVLEDGFTYVWAEGIAPGLPLERRHARFRREAACPEAACPEAEASASASAYTHASSSSA